MTEEKIKQGKELLKRLDHLKDQKKRWEKAVGFYRPEIKDSNRHNASTYNSFINFEEVKLLAIAKIDKRIDEVQREFDNL